MDFSRYRKGAPQQQLQQQQKRLSPSSPPRIKQVNLAPTATLRNTAADYVPIAERFGRAADELHSRMISCRLVDVTIAAVWLSMLIGPPLAYALRSKNASSFGDSPASAMLLLLLTSSLALTLCVLRILTSFQLKRRDETRVDRMANAPRIARHIAYVNEDSALAWWFWAGYVFAPFIYGLNTVLVLVWLFFVGITFVLAFVVLTLCAISVFSTVRCTRWMYTKGVQSNFMFNIAISAAYRDEWAKYCANEKRHYWFRREEV